MRALFISKIFPNSAEPLSAPFNRQQLAHLREFCEVEVLATIPTFPGAGYLGKWSSAGRLARVPEEEWIDGHRVRHPRTLFVPRLATSSWAPLYAASLLPTVLRYRGHVDVVLGAWAYPDGVAAVWLARALGVPCVVKVHGSDINSLAQQPGPRRQLRATLPRAERVVVVSRALGDAVAELGVMRERIALVQNGVDATLFAPSDRRAARAQLGWPEVPTLLFVGNLKEEKGVLDAAHAMADVVGSMPTARLVVVGEGAARAAVTALPQTQDGTVSLLGARPHADVAQLLAACDALVLPSWAEGTPNVVLEALASGRRVVATNVGGIPDLITSPVLGELVAPRDRAALGFAMLRALRVAYDPIEVARLGARGGWRQSAERLAQVLTDVVAARTTTTGAD